MPLRCYATVLWHYGALPLAVAAADGQRPHALLCPMLHLHRLHSVPCYTYIDCSSTQALLTLTAVQPKVTLYIDCSSTHVTLTLTAVHPMLHLHWAQFNSSCTAVHCTNAMCRAPDAGQCKQHSVSARRVQAAPLPAMLAKLQAHQHPARGGEDR